MFLIWSGNDFGNDLSLWKGGISELPTVVETRLLCFTKLLAQRSHRNRVSMVTETAWGDWLGTVLFQSVCHSISSLRHVLLQIHVGGDVKDTVRWAWSTLCDLHPSSPMPDFTLRYWLLGGGLFVGKITMVITIAVWMDRTSPLRHMLNSRRFVCMISSDAFWQGGGVPSFSPTRLMMSLRLSHICL